MKTILIGLCTLALSAGVSGAESATSPAERAIVAARSQRRRRGRFALPPWRQAINDDNYERAISIFRQVVDKYPKSTPAGDALYWRAWAAYQLGGSGTTRITSSRLSNRSSFSKRTIRKRRASPTREICAREFGLLRQAWATRKPLVKWCRRPRSFAVDILLRRR
jgi:hypothetical protein